MKESTDCTHKIALEDAAKFSKMVMDSVIGAIASDEYLVDDINDEFKRVCYLPRWEQVEQLSLFLSRWIEFSDGILIEVATWIVKNRGWNVST